MKSGFTVCIILCIKLLRKSDTRRKRAIKIQLTVIGVKNAIKIVFIGEMVAFSKCRLIPALTNIILWCNKIAPGSEKHY